MQELEKELELIAGYYGKSEKEALKAAIIKLLNKYGTKPEVIESSFSQPIPLGILN